MNKSELNNAKKVLVYTFTSWSVIFFGIFFRFSHYFSNRSLWHDEAKYAIKTIKYSYLELLMPHVGTQDPILSMISGPLGFYFLNKGIVQVCGQHEYVLRLLPFLCSIVSIFLFYKIIKYFLPPLASLIALTLFAINYGMIYYAAEYHPYSCDVLITLILYIIFYKIQFQDLSFSRSLIIILLGLIFITFSYPTLFVIAGLGGTVFFQTIKDKDYAKSVRLFYIFFIWILGFLFYYFFYIKGYVHSLSYWGRSNFMPDFPPSIEHLKWFVNKFCNAFAFSPLFLGFWAYGLALFILGLILSFVNNKKHFMWFFTPLFFTLLAAAFKKYPFINRLILFLVPVFIYFICFALDWLFEKVKFHPFVTTILIMTLIFLPVQLAVKVLYTPIVREEIKPLLLNIKKFKQKDDLVYVSDGTYPAFEYYKDRYGFVDGDYIIGTSKMVETENYIKDFQNLPKGRRVWFVFGHDYGSKFYQAVNYLNVHGTLLKQYKAKGARVYLFVMN